MKSWGTTLRISPPVNYPRGPHAVLPSHRYESAKLEIMPESIYYYMRRLMFRILPRKLSQQSEQLWLTFKEVLHMIKLRCQKHTSLGSPLAPLPKQMSTQQQKSQ